MASMAVLLLAACSKPMVQQQSADWSSVDTVLYDPDNTLQIMRETAIDSVWYVKLETVEESMIGSVDEIIFCDSTIIVADKRIGQTISMFDYQGHFLGRMSNLGNGPQEYLSLLNIAKLPDGTIAIYDSRRQKIDIFDERGNYLENIQCNQYARSVQFIDGETMVFDHGTTFRNKELEVDGGYASYLVKDRKMKTLYKFGATNFEDGFNFTRHYNLYSFDGKVFCNVNFEDIIYEMGRTAVCARYRLLMKPDQSSNYPISTIEDIKKLDNRYNHFNGNFIELKDYSYFNVAIMNPNYCATNLLFNHKDKRTYVLINDFNDPMMAFFGIPEYRYGDNCLVSWSSSSSIISHVDFMEEGSDDPNLLKLVDGMKRDDNPVLFFYRIAF